jgi:formylglycine-generating enzyme required for sulfatase activity
VHRAKAFSSNERWFIKRRTMNNGNRISEIIKAFVTTMFLFFMLDTPLPAAEVKNDAYWMEGNRALIKYDLVGDETETVVSVSITVQGKTHNTSELHLTGDYGKVKPGKDKKIYWNILQDFPKGLNAKVDIEVSSDNGCVFTSPIIGAKFLLLPAGTFMMGSSSGESDITPHQVTISKPFYMQITEVTQEQWKKVMGSNPSYFSSCGENCPVEKVSWNDVQEFIQTLNSMEGNNKYRLPTEAEWEYAARSGIKKELHSDKKNIDAVAWYKDNSDGSTHHVAQKKSNSLRIYDMSGNVWEWCQDWYGNYPSVPVTDPEGPSSGSARVIRGGGWAYRYPSHYRSADRDYYYPSSRSNLIGFRLIRMQ